MSAFSTALSGPWQRWQAWWAGRSLRVKLAALLALGIGLSVAIVASALLALAWWNAESLVRDDARANARALAFALQAPVSYSDTGGIREALAVLQARPQVVGAAVMDAKGVTLYRWGVVREGVHTDELGNLQEGWLEVIAPIRPRADAESLGWVTLRMDLGSTQAMLRHQIWVALLGTVAGLSLALVVSQRLARHISVPVVQLADAASAIARDHQFERRLPAAGHDEVGVAIAAFNHMLDEVQRRGEALAALNAALQSEAVHSQGARQLAEAASNAKTRFLANMSHELRSPLNGVIGAAQLLQAQGADPVRRAELVDMIRASGSTLLGLIESVLDLARIEAGALHLVLQDFNLHECIDAAVLSTSAAASAKGLQLSCVVAPNVAAWRHGDSMRLRQLLLNLLGNAVKFTPQGEVVLEVSPGEQEGDMHFAVRDSGIGISADALQTIFEPFQQADESTTRRFGGSGLGLSICRDLAQLMGGQVAVQSAPGNGSCFTLNLPLPLVQPAPLDAPLGLRVAWHEPHEASARALVSLLARLGCEALRCDDPDSLQEAMVQSDAQGRAPWFMVALDKPQGSALLASCAAWLDLTHVVPMGAHTEGAQAAALASQRDAAGLPRLLAKPLLRAALVSRLAQAHRHSEAKVVNDEEGNTEDCVLVVEDDATNRMVVCAMLDQAGYRSIVAHTGRQALAVLANTPVALVLMDWQMPDMDGLEATRKLRAGDAGEINRNVPVVALTANAFAEDRATCLAAGMNDFLTKPVLAAHLVGVVERWTAPDGVLTAWPSLGRMDSLRGELSATQRKGVPEAPDFDPDVLAALPMVADGSDPGYVASLLAMFTDITGEALDVMQAALARDDTDVVRRCVHSLKSSAAQVGALALSAQAAEQEAAMRAGQALGLGHVLALRVKLAAFAKASAVA